MRKKTIHIDWSRRIPIYEYERSSYLGERGVYMITRIWGMGLETEREERILYIGKTSVDFKSRISSHAEYWVPELRGSIFVRFGIIRENFDDDLLEDIESALIYQEQPEENEKKKNTYTFRTNYLPYIINSGCKHMITSEIDARKQLDPSTVE